jgi:2-iminobutanoate/2-iminopropanoate deaminase
MKEAVFPKGGARPTGAYSPGIRAGDFLFVSGQGPLDPATGTIVGGTIEEQVRRTLENVRAVLEAVGATMADSVKVQVHLADIRDFARFNAVYAEFFPDPRPARTTVESGLEGILVEIDAVAHVPRAG